MVDIVKSAGTMGRGYVAVYCYGIPYCALVKNEKHVYGGTTMTILNFSFTKILVEKNKKQSKKVSINSGLNIKDVEESNVVKGSKQRAFRISFSYTANYSPEIGKILLEGDLLYLADESTATTISNEWKDKKSLPKDIALVVFNRILHQCNVEALILSKEINLPAPVKLPKIQGEGSAKATKKGNSA
ncbi:MAG: hypothetical protein ACQESC_01055 [Nanobdellota archaeon]